MLGNIAKQVIAGVGTSKFGFATQFNSSIDVNNAVNYFFTSASTQNDVVKTKLVLSHELQLGSQRSL